MENNQQNSVPYKIQSRREYSKKNNLTLVFPIVWIPNFMEASCTACTIQYKPWHLVTQFSSASKHFVTRKSWHKQAVSYFTDRETEAHKKATAEPIPLFDSQVSILSLENMTHFVALHQS